MALSKTNNSPEALPDATAVDADKRNRPTLLDEDRAKDILLGIQLYLEKKSYAR